MRTLTPGESQELEELSRIYEAAGGNPSNPLEETTVRMSRWEREEQPEDTINPNQITRLTALFCKKTGIAVPE